jgi:glutamate--cysteine ligase
MARDVSDSTPVGSKDELISWIAVGEKPASAFRIGTEHEKFPFYREDNGAVPYDGRGAKGGIRHLLEGMQERLGWEPIVDAGHIIGLAGPDGGGAISLEPGGQFELSGAPVETLHETPTSSPAISPTSRRSLRPMASVSSRSATRRSGRARRRR